MRNLTIFAPSHGTHSYAKIHFAVGEKDESAQTAANEFVHGKVDTMKLKKMVISAMFAAVICVVTFAVRVPVPASVGGGYMNIGDAPIYIAGFLLGGPPGAMAAAIGASLADLLSGYALYMAPTFVVKGLMGLVAGTIAHKKGFARFMIGSISGGLIMVFGYAAFEAAYFNAGQALAGMPFNAIQFAGGILAAAILYPFAGRAARHFEL
jgi:uncharacterized membrane protein